MAKHRKRREPQLCYSETRGVGWHANYRDPETGVSRKKRFGVMPEDDARRLYRIWLLEHMDGISVEALLDAAQKRENPLPAVISTPRSDPQGSSLLTIASSLIRYEESRVREAGEPRRPGTITRKACADRKSTCVLF